MPIYEYNCKKCGQTIEIIQKFSDPVLKKHEGCGGALTKLISQSGFQFKGTGWYVTDYGRKGKSGGDSASDKKETASKSDSKDTSTPAKSPTSSSSTPRKSGDS